MCPEPAGTTSMVCALHGQVAGEFAKGVASGVIMYPMDLRQLAVPAGGYENAQSTQQFG